MTMGRSSSSRCSSSRSRRPGSGPTRCTRTGRARHARMAPRISGSGALSEPTASSAMSMSIGRSRLLFGFLTPEPRGPCTAPHLGQARWGSFFSWQLGHSETPVAVRKSWARRLAVRRVEWRLFGFGMVQFLSCLCPWIGSDLRPQTRLLSAFRPGQNTVISRG